MARLGDPGTARPAHGLPHPRRVMGRISGRELAIDGVTEAEGGLQRERQRSIPAPQTVVGAEMPLTLVVDGVFTALDLEGWVSQGT